MRPSLLNSLIAGIAPAALAMAMLAAPAAYGQDVYAKLEPRQKVRFEEAVVVSSQAISKRYADGLALRELGDDKGAFEAFLEAAEGGHAQAQRRLGEIYDRGNSAVQRDLLTSIRWYMLAREQGERLPEPITYRYIYGK